jgi:protein phosphatase 1 regulatory subunit 7
MKGALTGLSKTANNRSIAYTRLNLAEKELERLFPIVLRFKEVRFLDLNTNTVADISVVAGFEHLVWLNASKNQISNIDIFDEEHLEQLQILNLSGNKIKELRSIKVPALRRLNLSENEIAEVTWKGHHSIEILELRKNKLRKLKGIANMKQLQELYVCENELTDIRGLESLPQLHKLSVRNNKLKGLYNPFPQLPSLSYINLRENQITKLEELKKID